VHDVTIPALGMAMTEAILVQWYVEPGSEIGEGEVIAEIETDKSTVDLESPASGILGRHLVVAGATVPVGDPVVRILQPGEDEDSESAPPVAVSPNPDASSAAGRVTDDRSRGADTSASGEARPPGGRAPHALSPRQRMLARQAAGERTDGVAAVGGGVRAEPDVAGRNAAEGVAASRPRTDRRGAVAAAVTRSWQEIPQFSATREIGASLASAALERLRRAEPSATYTDLLLRAVAVAAHLPGASDRIGLAVATPNGVLMPSVVGAGALAPAALVAARRELVRRARDGRLTDSDLSGDVTISLSNLGPQGVDMFTGLVALGQEYLVTVGSVRERPVVVDGNVVAAPTLWATVNVDHRAHDGDAAAELLGGLAEAFDSVGDWVDGVQT
jgi:pyruvate dehydrogenase E2 component (dihydrolipoamide acetyltransferase)